MKPVPMLKVEPYYAPNQTVEISCDVATYPAPNITWSYMRCPYYPSYEDASTIELQVHNNFFKLMYYPENLDKIECFFFNYSVVFHA